MFQRGLVSVIIPTFNRAELLRESIRSVVEQTHRPIECIVVDDGSVDHTASVIGELMYLNDNDFTLLYLKQNNSGSQIARNTGTAASSGEFIQYLDSDDLLYADKINNQVVYLTNNLTCDGVFGDWEKGNEVNKEFIAGHLSNDIISQLLVDRSIANFSFLMRRSLISKIGEWDPQIKRNQEIDFQVRGILTGAVYHYQPVTTGLWRMHDDVRINNTTNLNDVVAFYQKMEHILSASNLFGTALQQKISFLYTWMIAQFIHQTNDSLILMLSEAVRLNPQIPLNNNKMKFLRMLIGNEKALHYWLNRKRNVKLRELKSKR